jgi:fatty-acyl-CoA synthase
MVLKRFEPYNVFELMAEEKVSVACMAPTMLNMLLNYPDTLRLDLPRTARIGTAGSAPPMAIIKALQERFGWRVIQVYGLTETSPFLTVSKLKPHMADWPDEEKYRVQTLTGYPMLGVDLRVVDDQGNDVVADGQHPGEVIARSNVVMAGYWRQADATASVIVDGWFHTGDVALLHEGGYIEIVDRMKDLIISGGENVSSIEVEGALYKYPGVLEAAVIAVPDDRWGEAPKALVVAKAGAKLTENELIEFCRGKLAHYKCPKSVDFVDSLPRTATGKVQKSVIRERYWQGREKRVQ